MLGLDILTGSIIFFLSLDWLNVGRTSEAPFLHTVQLWGLALMVCFNNKCLDYEGVLRSCPSTVTGNWITSMRLANRLQVLYEENTAWVVIEFGFHQRWKLSCWSVFIFGDYLAPVSSTKLGTKKAFGVGVPVALLPGSILWSET